MRDYKKSMTALEELLNASVSPFHAVKKSAEKLSAAGFKELKASEPFELVPGGKYYIDLYGSSLVAFAVGHNVAADKCAPMIRMGASHTDWPCLRVKPSPEMAQGGYGLLNVECYGGLLVQTWLDRPLSMAGRVCLKSDDPFKPVVKLIDFKRPLLVVPNLANHIKRENEKGVEPNKQTQMLPVIARLTEDLNKDSFFLDLLAKEAGVNKEDILDYDFYLYNTEKGCYYGINEEFYLSQRLDNITSVEGCLQGILNAERCGKNDDTISLIALYDNEEVGSRTKQGALSSSLDHLMEKIYLALGFTRDQYLSAMFKSFLLSMDVAHAYHPCMPNNYDPKNHVLMNDGVAIKMSSTQTYATDSTAVSAIEMICHENDIPYKKFSNRSDIRGGSTLGSLASALLGVKTCDIGLGLLAMHSTMESMGSHDQDALDRLVQKFFES